MEWRHKSPKVTVKILMVICSDMQFLIQNNIIIIITAFHLRCSITLNKKFVGV